MREEIEEEAKKDNELKSFVSIGDVFIGSRDKGINEISKIALRIHRIRNNKKPSYI